MFSEHISKDEWLQLQGLMILDMERDIAALRNALAKADATSAWQVVHRILGMALWFKLSAIADSASSVQISIEKGLFGEVELEPLEQAIASFALATDAGRGAIA